MSVAHSGSPDTEDLWNPWNKVLTALYEVPVFGLDILLAACPRIIFSRWRQVRSRRADIPFPSGRWNSCVYSWSQRIGARSCPHPSINKCQVTDFKKNKNVKLQALSLYKLRLSTSITTLQLEDMFNTLQHESELSLCQAVSWAEPTCRKLTWNKSYLTGQKEGTSFPCHKIWCHEIILTQTIKLIMPKKVNLSRRIAGGRQGECRWAVCPNERLEVWGGSGGVVIFLQPNSARFLKIFVGFLDCSRVF